MLSSLCSKSGCDYQLDLDGQVTCINCGAMDDDMQSIIVDNIEIESVDTVGEKIDFRDNSVFENQIDFE